MTDTTATQEKASDILAQAVYQEFKGRPIVITAALKQFSAALNNKYPELNINVLTTTLNTPNWVSGIRITEGADDGSGLVAGEATWIDGYTTTPLLELMIQSICAKAQLYFTSEHFLSDANNKRMEVDLREVEDLLRRLPKVMVPALQQALTEYWSEPAVEGTSRWQWFSDVLKTALLARIEQEGGGATTLDQEQIDTLLQVIHYPTKLERSIHYGQACAQAFLFDYLARTGRTTSASLSYAVVVTRKIEDREIVLRFEPHGAVETYDSLQAFAHAQGIKWGRRMELTVLELQPYESMGDVFVTQAQALLNNQLESLSSLGAFEGQDLKALEDRTARLTDPAPYLLKHNPDPYEQKLYGEVKSQLPDWIDLATPAETQEYSRCMFRFGVLQQATKGKVYTDGLRATEQFAKDALLAGMAKYGETLDPDTLKITQTRYIADAPGAPTGSAITETDSLTRRAMKGLAGLLHFKTTIKSADGNALPAWVTEDNLRSLIADVDIGRHYPEEVRKVLLEDLERRPGREKLYADQQRVQIAGRR
ncbi:hypothetical protein [Pseudomonas fluorescens]|uniref:Uncharacterized protein n=1 Tax=Pseudomonas fluorescens TaxID=294 RepID=A0A5E7BDE0_PSEFL|nr:hypothetical protein [Pseudomonas fluorescens]VVN89529.1 hypothetical protein PS691_01752 [Pseudomonas fluorescens]